MPLTVNDKMAKTVFMLDERGKNCFIAGVYLRTECAATHSSFWVKRNPSFFILYSLTCKRIDLQDGVNVEIKGLLHHTIIYNYQLQT